MKKTLLSLALLLSSYAGFTQVLPSVQFGLKAGVNLSKFSTENTFSSTNRAGYYGGVWARLGAAGIHFQPELYLSGKNTTLETSNNQENEVNFTSLDLPLLIGTKIGAAGVGVRFNTGPVISFILNEEQKFGQAAQSAFNGDFKGQAFAWQLGTGIDISKLSVDLRYEKGLSKLNKAGYPDTKLNMFTLGLGLRLF